MTVRDQMKDWEKSGEGETLVLILTSLLFYYCVMITFTVSQIIFFSEHQALKF